MCEGGGKLPKGPGVRTRSTVTGVFTENLREKGAIVRLMFIVNNARKKVEGIDCAT